MMNLPELEAKKPLPNNKLALLEGKNYEMYNLDVMRKVFPRIIGEYEAIYQRKQRKPQFRDIIALYFYLLSYVDGRHTRADGSASVRFGASFPSKDKISSELGIAESRIKPLVDVLVTNGLILSVRDHWEGTRRSKWYFVSFCPNITEDGYVISEDSEKVMPDLSIYQ